MTRSYCKEKGWDHNRRYVTVDATFSTRALLKQRACRSVETMVNCDGYPPMPNSYCGNPVPPGNTYCRSCLKRAGLPFVAWKADPGSPRRVTAHRPRMDVTFTPVEVFRTDPLQGQVEDFFDRVQSVVFKSNAGLIYEDVSAVVDLFGVSNDIETLAQPTQAREPPSSARSIAEETTVGIGNDVGGAIFKPAALVVDACRPAVRALIRSIRTEIAKEVGAIGSLAFDVLIKVVAGFMENVVKLVTPYVGCGYSIVSVIREGVQATRSHWAVRRVVRTPDPKQCRSARQLKDAIIELLREVRAAAVVDLGISAIAVVGKTASTAFDLSGVASSAVGLAEGCAKVMLAVYAVVEDIKDHIQINRLLKRRDVTLETIQRHPILAAFVFGQVDCSALFGMPLATTGAMQREALQLSREYRDVIVGAAQSLRAGSRLALKMRNGEYFR